MPEKKVLRPSNWKSLFPHLKSFACGEVETLRIGAVLLKEVPAWKSWIEETLCDLLEVPQGVVLSLAQSSELHDEEARSYSFTNQSITIGRSDENDISLPQRSISRKHTSIVYRDSAFYIEDMESASGTYVNRQKLHPRQPKPLQNGDEILIFPYAFTVTQQELWSKDSELEVTYSTRLTPSAASAFIASVGSDLCLFQLRLHPDLGYAVLALPRSFITVLLSRLTRESMPDLLEADGGLLEFIVVSVIERANRELRFPFQCSLVPHRQFELEEEPGLMMEAMVKLSGAHGRVSLFFSDRGLRKIQRAETTVALDNLPGQLTWSIPVRLGSLTLHAADLMSLEIGDTLLYSEQLELALPGGRSERGWSMERSEGDDKFVVREYFERIAVMEEVTNVQTQLASEGVMDMTSLPIRIHIVIGETELSVQQLGQLREGSILELADITGQVQLVANGKVLGTGELVHVEEHPGVQITRWQTHNG